MKLGRADPVSRVGRHAQQLAHCGLVLHRPGVAVAHRSDALKGLRLGRKHGEARSQEQGVAEGEVVTRLLIGGITHQRHSIGAVAAAAQLGTTSTWRLADRALWPSRQ